MEPSVVIMIGKIGPPGGGWWGEGFSEASKPRGFRLGFVSGRALYVLMLLERQVYSNW